MIAALDDPAIHDYMSSSGRLEFDFGEVRVSEIAETILSHKRRVDRLRGAGMLEPYVALTARVDAETRAALQRTTSQRPLDTFEATLRNDPGTLELRSFELRAVAKSAAKEHSHLLSYLEDFGSTGPGSAWVRTDLGGYPPVEVRRATSPGRAPITWAEFVDQRAKWISNGLARLLEAILFEDALE
jgi:hypothetical protein